MFLFLFLFLISSPRMWYRGGPFIISKSDIYHQANPPRHSSSSSITSGNNQRACPGPHRLAHTTNTLNNINFTCEAIPVRPASFPLSCHFSPTGHTKGLLSVPRFSSTDVDIDARASQGEASNVGTSCPPFRLLNPKMFAFSCCRAYVPPQQCPPSMRQLCPRFALPGPGTQTPSSRDIAMHDMVRRAVTVMLCEGIGNSSVLPATGDVEIRVPSTALAAGRFSSAHRCRVSGSWTVGVRAETRPHPPT